MAPLRPPDQGFVANTHSSRAPPRRKARRSTLMGLSIAVLCLMSALLLVPRHDSVGGTSGDVTAASPPNNCYKLRVYALNQTAMEKKGSSTYFAFDVTDLPFDIGSLRFGDFRADTSYNHSYYGGSGLLLSATGTNGTIVLTEYSSKAVSSVWYHGQSLLVFSGETRYSSGSECITVNGTDIMVQDWRNGDWSPESGIILLHPSTSTLSYAKFYVMVFEPAYDLLIPEYKVLPVLAACLLILLVGRRARSVPRS